MHIQRNRVRSRSWTCRSLDLRPVAVLALAFAVNVSEAVAGDARGVSVAYEGVCAGKRFVVTEGEVWRDNQSVGRSGHMGHALVDCGDGRILDFTSNCAGRERVSGHSGYGWMEYRISDDYGKTFGPVRVLPCSRKMYEEGRHTALCEKAVRAPDGRIVLFFQITDTSQPISCEPWSPPLMAVSSDRGETFSDFMPTGADAGRIYDAVCDDRYIYFIMQSNPHFLGTRPEHVYKVYRAGRDLKFSASVLPIDAMGRGYGALEFSADGKLHAYAYNSKCETEMDYTVSCDRGETWSAPGKSHVALKIRNPQIRRLDDIWFLIGRNGGSPADALVFYASPDGVNWDGGVRLDVRPAGTGTGYYGCMLPIREPGRSPRMLMQYSRPYLGSCVNVMHRTIVLPDEADPASFVDTRIGGSYRGHTFPGATCPFSLVQASPDTGLCDWDHCSGYVWEDPFIYGFSQTHLSGTGCPDLADVRILPFSADFAEKDPVKWRQAKDFRSERGTPGFYTVALTNDGIVAEVTATPRVGVYRFTYSAGRPVRLLVDMQWVNTHNIRGAVAEFASVLGDDRRSIGGIRRTYGWLRRNTSWHVVFDRPWTKATKLPPADPKERGERYVLEFAAGAPLVVKAAISTVNVAGARKNFAAEAEGRGFDDLRAAARGRWNALLSRMRTPGASAAQKTAFYTALYHLFIQPNDIADVDGLYRGADRQVVQAKGGTYYTGLSLWDTFRAAHPFYTLAIPERVDGFVVSMLAHYKALGFLPVIPYFGWESYCMIGNHSVPVIVDAYKKGFRGFDVDLAFEAVTNSLTVTHRNLDGGAKIKENWDLYDRYGYYPYDKIRAESVSRTLECGYDDWCAAELCKALGRGDEAFFRKRAAYW